MLRHYSKKMSLLELIPCSNTKGKKKSKRNDKNGGGQGRCSTGEKARSIDTP